MFEHLVYASLLAKKNLSKSQFYIILCYPPDPIARVNGFYGQGAGPIWLANVGCNGRENSLFECYADGRTQTATHVTDAGVKCFPKGLPVQKYSISHRREKLYNKTFFCLPL